MPSPPKPWEVNGGTAAASTPVVTESSMATTTNPTSALTDSSIPSIPNRPGTMGTMNGLGTGYGTGGYSSSIGGVGGYGTGYGTGYGSSYGSSYSSPYNRFGSSYGSYGGGYGSYGGGYGSSYGGGYGGYGGYNRFGSGFGGGMYGQQGMGGPDDTSLTQRMETSTRATFNVIESIVGAFGGFAQMLDSTYMATHSSFMAMVGVAEQFGNLRVYLGNILGIFALIRWIKKLLYRITGRTPPPELTTEQQDQQTEGANQITENGEPVEGQQQQQQQQQVARVSRKRPILIFLALVTGIPYLMYRLIKRSNEYRAQQMRMMIPQPSMGPPEMARAMFDFVAEQPIELNLRKGEVVEVLSKVDPATGAPCEWWQGRTSNGSIGIFPANYVQIESKGY